MSKWESFPNDKGQTESLVPGGKFQSWNVYKRNCKGMTHFTFKSGRD